MAIHPGSIWIEQNWSQTPKELWIAADQNGIVSKEKNLEDIYADLKHKSIDLRNVIITYITNGIIQ